SPTSSYVEKPICCRAFAIAENSTVGRFVVATREVRPLETVLEDFPVRDWLLRLMDHIPDIKLDPTHCQYLEEIVQFLSGVFPSERVERAYGILRVNSFGFTTPQGGDGRALYPLVALMSHSCQPNVQHVQSGSDSRVKLVAQRLIKPGEEMTISYINTFQGPLERRRSLKEQWFFDCSCSRCEDISDGGLFSHAVLCQKCFDRVLPRDQQNPATTWICQGCQTQYAANYAKDREIQVAKEWENEAMDRANIKQCEDFIQKVESQSLSEFNHFLVKIKSHLAVLYTVRESAETLANRPILERRVELCQSIIKYLYHMDKGQTKKLGVFLLELNKPKMRLAKLNFDQGLSTRKEYLKSLAEGARTETQAKNMIGRYKLVNSFAIKSEACKYEHQ
ncbi:hypothetical protein TCAL_06628, partial [Tigriopus californicus]